MFSELSDIMKDDSSLTLTVLDALSNLNAPENVVLAVVNDVLDKLNSANVSDVPIMVKFLMQSANDEIAENVCCVIDCNAVCLK